MANVPAQTTSSRLSKIGMGPKLLGVGVALFVLTRIIKWLPLDWVDGPINALLWICILACVVVGGGLTYLKAKKS